MSKVTILDVLKTASIEEMTAELNELTSQRDVRLSEMNAGIEALTLAIKLADLAQHGKQKKERKPRAAKSTPSVYSTPRPNQTTRLAPGGGLTIADRAVVYLQAAGEATPTAISKGLQLSNQTSIYSALNDPRFESTGRGTYRLANP